MGERLEVESPHPRARVTGVAEHVNGRVLERVESVGKNLLLHFEGGVVVRSHLRMSGRWRLERRGAKRVGTPWLVLRGREHEGVLWNGPVLEVERRPVRRRLGPDVLAEEFDAGRVLAAIRRHGDRYLGEALQHQRLVAGIGNMWMAEALWEVRVSPWTPVRDVADDTIVAALAAARRLMQGALSSGRPGRNVYRRAGRPCRRCGTIVLSRGLGDANRTAYWCPGCQAGGGPPGT